MIFEKIETPYLEKVFTPKSDLIIHINRINFSDHSIFEKYKFLSLKNSAYFSIARGLKDELFLLPKLYVALTYLTGAGDSNYDPYKGSYSFTFELKVQKKDNESHYIFHIYHYRSYLEFNVTQIVPKTDPRKDNIMQNPTAEFFSDEDICYFCQYFVGYCLGFIKNLKYIPQPFWKSSESNLLLFGYAENDYFYKKYRDCNEYEKEKSLLKEMMGS